MEYKKKMKNFSLIFNDIVNKLFISLFFNFLTIGCYSFRGGTLPEHIKTITISPIIDNSNYGNPLYKELILNTLVKKFQQDNTLKITEAGGDSKLRITLNSIREETAFVRQGELEKERKLIIELSVEFYDAIKNRVIWQRNFSNYSIFPVFGIPASRDESATEVIEKITDDVLLSTVSGW